MSLGAEDDGGCWVDDEDLRPVRASQIDMVRAVVGHRQNRTVGDQELKYEDRSEAKR